MLGQGLGAYRGILTLWAWSGAWESDFSNPQVALMQDPDVSFPERKFSVFHTCPCELLGGLSGLLSLRCLGLRSCVKSVPEPEVSSPVLHASWGISGVSPGESVLVSSGGMHVRFPP